MRKPFVFHGSRRLHKTMCKTAKKNHTVAIQLDEDKKTIYLSYAQCRNTDTFIRKQGSTTATVRLEKLKKVKKENEFFIVSDSPLSTSLIKNEVPSSISEHINYYLKKSIDAAKIQNKRFFVKVYVPNSTALTFNWDN